MLQIGHYGHTIHEITTPENSFRELAKCSETTTRYVHFELGAESTII